MARNILPLLPYAIRYNCLSSTFFFFAWINQSHKNIRFLIRTVKINQIKSTCVIVTQHNTQEVNFIISVRIDKVITINWTMLLSCRYNIHTFMIITNQIKEAVKSVLIGLTNIFIFSMKMVSLLLLTTFFLLSHLQTKCRSICR